jgi:CheY-like chemotaxis protein
VEARGSSRAATQQGAKARKLRVLLAEDDPGTATMYQIGLELHGHVVRVARDGEEALQMVRSEAPDIVLLDIEMPKLDGVRMVELLRQQPETKQLPVVILSNTQRDGTLVLRLRALGVFGWMVKSRTSPRQLAAVLDRWRRQGERAMTGPAARATIESAIDDIMQGVPGTRAGPRRSG